MSESPHPENRAPWEYRAEAQFTKLLRWLTIFAIVVLGLIGGGIYGKYCIEMHRIDKAAGRGGEAPAPAVADAVAPRFEPQAETLSTAQAVLIVDGYVAAASKAREKEGKPSAIPFREVADFIAGLVDTKALTTDARATLTETAKKVRDAALDVGVDTIKKITGKLLGPGEKPDAKAGKGNELLGNLNVNVSCAAQPVAYRPNPIPTPNPPKQPAPAPPKAECKAPPCSTCPG